MLHAEKDQKKRRPRSKSYSEAAFKRTNQKKESKSTKMTTDAKSLSPDAVTSGTREQVELGPAKNQKCNFGTESGDLEKFCKKKNKEEAKPGRKLGKSKRKIPQFRRVKQSVSGQKIPRVDIRKMTGMKNVAESVKSRDCP